MNESLNAGLYEDVNYTAVLRAIKMCFVYIDDIKLKVLGIAEEGRKSAFFDEKSFSEMIDKLDVFVGLISDIYRTLKKHHVCDNLCTETIQALEIHLLFIFKALLAAKHKRDFVMLMDLLEYELMENIIQWKIKIIPELKKIKELVDVERI